MTDLTETPTAVVAQEMGDILAMDPLDESDDFFLNGGDSLRAVELITRLCGRYAAADPDESGQLSSALLMAVFDDPTPAGLGHLIEQHLER